MESTFRLGRILGIPVGVHYSWFLVLFLVTFLLSDEFGGGLGGWIIALLTTGLFFGSVVVHELSHSVVALAKGIPVRGITLFIFGGVSQIAREASRPATELMVAIVGPLSSALLGALFWGLTRALDGANQDLARMTELLAGLNITLAVFNMLPGFPMDGGRVLRAVVWWVTRSYWVATHIASMAGLVVALLIVGSGIALMVLDSVTQGIWLVLIGVFIGSAAAASQSQLRYRQALRHHTALDLMSPQCPSVAAGTTLAQLAQRLGGPPRSLQLPVTQWGQATGIINADSFRSTPPQLWGTTLVESVSVPLESAVKVAPEDDALSVLDLMEEKDVGQVLVVTNGTLLGCLMRDSLVGRAGKRVG